MSDLPLVVLDASVIVKWYLPGENDTVEAAAFKDRYLPSISRIVVPAVIRYEVANAVSVALRRGRISAEDARQATVDFLSWDFTFVESGDLILAAADTARRLDCAFYDALYLTVAEIAGCDFVTDDRSLFAKTHTQLPWVKLLGDDERP
jgi:predicted nucleic acid-binding protein